MSDEQPDQQPGQQPWWAAPTEQAPTEAVPAAAAVPQYNPDPSSDETPRYDASPRYDATASYDSIPPYDPAAPSASPYGSTYPAAQYSQSQYGTPQYGTPQYGTPQYGTPQYGTPQYGTPQYATPQYATPQYGAAQHQAPSAYNTPLASPPSSLDHPGNPNGRRRSGWPSLFAVAGISALVGALVAGGLVAASKKTKTSTDAVPPPASENSARPVVSLPAGSVAQIARTLLPSVVSIIVTSGESGDEGTGIVLSSDGNILTNNHVVEGAATAGTIAVTLNDGRTVKASVVGRDPTTDLAVIKLAGVTGLHPATLGSDASLIVGQQVIAIGSPLGLSNTVTSGIVSSLNRPVCTQNCDGSAGSNAATPTVLDAIQTDAAINPGNSGGPLVDMAGQVVGVNSAIATLDQGLSGSDAQSGSIGVGFSIPIDEARRVVDELEKNGHANHAVLGISLQDSLDATLHTPNGAKVVKVTDGGPAAKAGIKVDDVIVKFGARTIVDADSLIAATHAAVPDSTVSITYQRGGQPTTVQLTLGSAASS
jgi:putative serine protease PepD